eukprot:3976143-Prymnesium_polylepis.2
MVTRGQRLLGTKSTKRNGRSQQGLPGGLLTIPHAGQAGAGHARTQTARPITRTRPSRAASVPLHEPR